MTGYKFDPTLSKLRYVPLLLIQRNKNFAFLIKYKRTNFAFLVEGEQSKGGMTTKHLAALMEPAALTAFVLGAWILAADIGLAQRFVVQEGAFSNWMFWCAGGAGIKYLSSRLAGGWTAARHLPGSEGPNA